MALQYATKTACGSQKVNFNVLMFFLCFNDAERVLFAIAELFVHPFDMYDDPGIAIAVSSIYRHFR